MKPDPAITSNTETCIVIVCTFFVQLISFFTQHVGIENNAWINALKYLFDQRLLVTMFPKYDEC